MDNNDFIGVIAVIVLVLAGAFFSAADFSDTVSNMKAATQSRSTAR